MRLVKILTILFLLPSLTSFTPDSNSKTRQIQKDYIDTYSIIAIQEMHRSSIPASITLAQGILESNWGQGSLAVNSNNHFGIKCKKTWTGKKYFHKDDDYKNGVLIKSCFRVYDDVLRSYQDHSDFLVNNQRYHWLFDLKPTDYKAWAKGLKKSGYATDPKYADKLIRLIEEHGLYVYDKKAASSNYSKTRFQYSIPPKPQRLEERIEIPEPVKLSESEKPEVNNFQSPYVPKPIKLNTDTQEDMNESVKENNTSSTKPDTTPAAMHLPANRVRQLTRPLKHKIRPR